MADSRAESQLKTIVQRLEKAGTDAQQAVRGALYLEAVAMMRKSLAQVPVDTGILRSTAYVSLPSMASRISLRLGYGTNYATHVHDIPATHLPPTKDRFLADPVNEALPGLSQRVAKRAKQLRAQGKTWEGTPLVPQAPGVSLRTAQLVSKVAKQKARKAATKARKSKVRGR